MSAGANVLLDRAWARPAAWSKSLRQRSRSRSRWPDSALLLATAASPSIGESLQLGACALLPSLLDGQRPLDVRIFYPDDCPHTQVERLRQAAAARGLAEPISRRQFAQLWRRRCYKQRLPLVAYRLPPQLGRIAAGWRSIVGGFSLILATRPPPPGRSTDDQRRRPLLQDGEIEDGYYPRVTIRPLDGERSSIALTGRGDADDTDRIPDGDSGRPRDK
jgi:hypothetical protein